MKKTSHLFINVLLLMSFMIPCSLMADGIIPLQGGWDNGNIGNPYPKAPIQVPQVEQDNFTLYFIGEHADYTLCLLDSNEDVVYTTYVPSSATTVVLPSTLQGTYEIRLLTSTVYFYGLITL